MAYRTTESGKIVSFEETEGGRLTSRRYSEQIKEGYTWQKNVIPMQIIMLGPEYREKGLDMFIGREAFDNEGRIMKEFCSVFTRPQQHN